MCFVKLDAYQPFFFFGFSGGVKAYLRGLLFFFFGELHSPARPISTTLQLFVFPSNPE